MRSVKNKAGFSSAPWVISLTLIDMDMSIFLHSFQNAGDHMIESPDTWVTGLVSPVGI